MSFSFLSTKLFFPPERPNLVPRPHLIERLNAGLRGSLTLISAPAGYGKTTIMSEWHTGIGCNYPVVWLSLDPGDNDPNRFLKYLVIALDMLETGLLNNTAELLNSPQLPPSEVFLTSLINDLNGYPHDFVLILDDYHAITNQAIHEMIGFLLDRQPKQMHMVVLTRSDPPLPLARLRSRNQLAEIRASDLRFTNIEAAAFFNKVMGLELSTNDTAVMEMRTEGWVAGLQMAALSMQGRVDISSFIQTFSGSNRYILDYLADEVISQQPESVQKFLLQTSILKQLSGSLCDAVIEQSGSQNTLEQIEKANLFLVPLDDERRWYRYHHLFADLLRVRLDRFYPGLAPHLHQRAAIWMENEGITVEAINHALAAGEHDLAARLVEKNTTRLLAQGEMNSLMGWIGELPLELRQGRPWLCIHQAYALAFAGRLAEVPALLTQAEASLGESPITDRIQKADTHPESPGEAVALAGSVAAIRAMVSVMSGEDTRAISLAQQARELLPDGNLWDRATAAWALGFALRSTGQLPEARSAFEEQIQLGRAMGNIWTLVTGLTDLAQVLRAQGQLPRARAMLEEALTEAGKQGARSLGYIARMEAILAGVLYEQNDLDAANDLLTEAIAHTHQWPNPNHMAYAFALQARVHLARNDFQSAKNAIDEANRAGMSTALTRITRRMVEVNLVRVWLALQKAEVTLAPMDPLPEQANMILKNWSSEMENPAKYKDEGTESAALILAAISRFGGQEEKALDLLAQVTRDTRDNGEINMTIASLILTAVALKERKTSSSEQGVTALSALEEALSLAEPGGYIRVFLDEGQPIQLLLIQWLVHPGTSPLKPYVVRLLNHFDREPPHGTPLKENASPNNNLVEPLSPRELEILHLIAHGITNHEIARQLIIAPGTVKAHTSSIYRKLDVANRTEAVAHATQLGILP